MDEDKLIIKVQKQSQEIIIWAGVVAAGALAVYIISKLISKECP